MKNQNSKRWMGHKFINETQKTWHYDSLIFFLISTPLCPNDSFIHPVALIQMDQMDVSMWKYLRAEMTDERENIPPFVPS